MPRERTNLQRCTRGGGFFGGSHKSGNRLVTLRQYHLVPSLDLLNQIRELPSCDFCSDCHGEILRLFVEESRVVRQQTFG